MRQRVIQVRTTAAGRTALQRASGTSAQRVRGRHRRIPTAPEGERRFPEARGRPAPGRDLLSPEVLHRFCSHAPGDCTTLVLAGRLDGTAEATARRRESEGWRAWSLRRSGGSRTRPTPHAASRVSRAKRYQSFQRRIGRAVIFSVSCRSVCRVYALTAGLRAGKDCEVAPVRLGCDAPTGATKEVAACRSFIPALGRNARR